MIIWNKVDKRIEMFNLYKRNMYKFFYNYKLYYMNKRLRKIISYICTEVNALFLHQIYLNYIEIPITTKCTLRCKECCNLIQYYERPYEINSANIIRDVKRLCKVTSGIGMLRILGGEPLLHKDLDKIINYLVSEPQIMEIQIVTNGTMIPSKEILHAMRSKKVSVDISNYKENSYKLNELVYILKKNHVTYHVSKNLLWTKQSDFTYRNRNEDQLVKIMQKCHLDCISMLEGNLHLCPRSSHGNDLCIFKAKDTDFFNVRARGKRCERKKKLEKVLKRAYITACNYCDVYRWEDLTPCVPGEQITRKAALDIFNQRKKDEYGKV